MSSGVPRGSDISGLWRKIIQGVPIYFFVLACARPAAVGADAALLQRAREAQEQGRWEEAAEVFLRAGGEEGRWGAALAAQRATHLVGTLQQGAESAQFLEDGRPLLAQRQGSFAAVTAGPEQARCDHGAPLASVAVEGGVVITRGGGTTRLWTPGCRPLFSVALPDDAPVAVAADGSGLVAWQGGLWVLGAKARVQVFKSSQSARLQLGGRALAAVRLPDGELQLWSTLDRKLVAQRRGVGEAFSLAPDGVRLAFSDAQGVHLGTVAKEGDALLDALPASRFAWGADLLAACGDRPGVRVFSTRARTLEHRLAAPAGPCALARHDEALIAAGLLFQLPGSPPRADSFGLYAAAFTPRGELVTFAEQGKVATWSLPGPEEHGGGWVRPASPCGASALAITGDGRTLAAPGVQGAQLFRFGGPGLEKGPLIEGEFAALAFTGDGSVLAASGWPDRLAAFGADGTPRFQLKQFACTLAGAPDGSSIAAGGREGSVRLLEPRSGTPLRDLPALQGPVRALAFSPDGSLLAAGADEAFIVVYSVADTESHKPQRLAAGSPPRAIVFSRKGLIAAGGEDGRVRIFTLQSGALLATLPPLGAPVTALAFSPAQDWLASGRRDFGGARLTALPASATAR